MNIQIRKIADELKLLAPDLITRMNGRLIYEKVMDRIKDAATDETVMFDLSSIKVMDASFIDELIVKTIKESKTREKRFYLKLKNISSATEINIDSVFDTYSYYNSEKIAVITDDICQNNNFFIGSLSSVEKDILDYLRVNMSAELKDLAEITGLDDEEMERITVELYSLRLVRRTGDNKFGKI
jgi:anti-anti-sigma regulatory factor